MYNKKFLMENPYLNMDRLTLTGKKKDGAFKNPTLTFNFRDMKPRLVAYKNDKEIFTKEDRWNNMTIFEFDINAFAIYVELAQKVIEGKAGGMFKQKYIDMTFDDKGKPTGNYELKATLEFHKDSDGAIYVKLYEPNETETIRYYFNKPFRYDITDADDNPIPEAAISRNSALGQIKMQMDIVNILMVHYSVGTPHKRRIKNG